MTPKVSDFLNPRLARKAVECLTARILVTAFLEASAFEVYHRKLKEDDVASLCHDLKKPAIQPALEPEAFARLGKKCRNFYRDSPACQNLATLLDMHEEPFKMLLHAMVWLHELDPEGFENHMGEIAVLMVSKDGLGVNGALRLMLAMQTANPMEEVG